MIPGHFILYSTIITMLYEFIQSNDILFGRLSALLTSSIKECSFVNYFTYFEESINFLDSFVIFFTIIWCNTSWCQNRFCLFSQIINKSANLLGFTLWAESWGISEFLKSLLPTGPVIWITEIERIRWLRSNHSHPTPVNMWYQLICFLQLIADSIYLFTAK